MVTNCRMTAKKAGAGKTVAIMAQAKDKGGAKASIKIKIMEHAITSTKIIRRWYKEVSTCKYQDSVKNKKTSGCQPGMPGGFCWKLEALYD